jgi:fumarate reductase flavoprotein subunit
MLAHEGAERATRDVVSRAIFDEIRHGRGTAGGGVHISMAHLGPDKVRAMFKGMVERCADVGYDLAGGLVEVVPTAHYMMGGVEVSIDCETALAGLFVAGEDAGGVHGSNRLGGNGVANSTVFGGIAGDVMAAWVPRAGAFVEPDATAIEAARARAEHPFAAPEGDLNGLRIKLIDGMWENAGILRDRAGLVRAAAMLDGLGEALSQTGIADGDRAFNLAWHDWLNLESQIQASRAIVAAALAREDSRGAHYREDFPEPGDLESSYFTRARLADGEVTVTTQPVEFTRVQPGQSLIAEERAE